MYYEYCINVITITDDEIEETYIINCDDASKYDAIRKEAEQYYQELIDSDNAAEVTLVEKSLAHFIVRALNLKTNKFWNTEFIIGRIMKDR